MTNEEKKEVFLLIIENWFNDKTGQIKSDNCIGFYHYLLDCFEFEEKFFCEYDKLDFKLIIESIIHFLSNFHLYIKDKIDQVESLKNLISIRYKNITPSKLEVFLSRIIELYICFRDEYLI